MYGIKSAKLAGIIVPATLGWNGNSPIKNPFLGGEFVPRCTKNGKESKERVTFELLIQDSSEQGYEVVKVTCFSSLNQQDPLKGFATRIAKLLVPGRYVEIDGAVIDQREISLTNTDGTQVMMNGQQVKKTYTSYIANPGTVRIYNRDSLEAMKLLHGHYLRMKGREHAEWDFLWRPASLWIQADGTMADMPTDLRTVLEAANKVRSAMPFILGMRSFGFCAVKYPENVQSYHNKSSDAYMAWLKSMIQAGVYGQDGLPVFTPKTAAPASTNASSIPGLDIGGAPASTDPLANLTGATGGDSQTEQLMKVVAQLLNKGAQTSSAPTVDLSNLGGSSTAAGGAGIPLI